MSNGPAAPGPAAEGPPLWQLWRDLAEAQARTSQSVADQGARLAAVERSVPELAARLEGRVAALDAQIGRQADHLAAQDQAAERARLEQKSRDGLIQQRLDALAAAEQQRAEEAQQAAADAKEAQQRTQEAQERAREQAAEQRTEYRRWALQTVASVGLMLPGLLWPLIVTRPLPLRLGVPAACIALVLLLAAWAWVRSRR